MISSLQRCELTVSASKKYTGIGLPNIMPPETRIHLSPKNSLHGFYYMGEMKVSFIFSPGEDLTKIPLSGTFRHITEKNTLLFLWCPRPMFPAPKYPVLPSGGSPKDAPD
ncbi:hypothetical protein TNCV_4709971 [Trichonephila clavipes]|nr:hypothetical protein TNCV_4709971 [Trichonephila clavipes]